MKKREKERQTLELILDPGSAQVDFGKADFICRGNKERLKYLVISIPYCNDSYTQIFAECVVEGLKTVFKYIGVVPRLLVFDNATGVVHHIQNEIWETELFAHFHAHYSFVCRFCIPHAVMKKKMWRTRSGMYATISLSRFRPLMTGMPSTASCWKLIRKRLLKFITKSSRRFSPVVSRFFRKFISSASKYRHQMYGFSSSTGCSISILNRCSMSM